VTEDRMQRLLESVRNKRGYLLPHHGLMALTMPALLDAYDEMYTVLALTERRLSRRDHEVVWLAILVAMEEALATHHIARFRDAGGSDEELAGALSVTALVRGCSAYQFVDSKWRAHLEDFDARRRYLDAFRAAAGAGRLGVAHMAAVAAFTCFGNWQGLEWQLVAAYEDGVDELGIAESLSLTMFPGGVPNFVEAAGVWLRLISSGAVPASGEFRTWASIAGQGGYDEASGIYGAEE